ncbi:DUF4136 domain-containing protein [Desulfosarcina sp. OttesenSCG-928-G10]|nr:DUF4136 domain-containing protein [Desulfosarcina sp. OttesenSCG-928-G10]MDL2321087.1 DUF4136 domain-containing protein [Desulfosarcina sp. OttesenSCG-928-B08]
MMRKTKWGAAVILGVIWLAGCAGIETRQDYDTRADFSRLGTFSWAEAAPPETSDPRVTNPLLHARIHSAVEQCLTSRGFSKVVPIQGAPPSFQVRYYYTLRPRVDTGSGLGVGIGIGTGGRRSGGGIAVGTGNTIDTYDEAELTIDILGRVPDDPQNTLLWRGTGTCRFAENTDPAAADAAIHRLVTAILAPFPPKNPG